jgi:hypothetical protein
MGIKVSSGHGPMQFFKINMRDGCFTQGSGASKVVYEPGRTVLEGVLVGAKVEEDVYEGVKHENLILTFNDVEPGKPRMAVTFGLTTDGIPTSSGLKVLAALVNVDVSKSVALNPYKITAGTTLGNTVYEKDVTGVSIKQGGQKVPYDYGTADNKLPECPEVIVNGKPFVQNGRPVKDRSSWEPILDTMLAKFFAKFDQGEEQQQGDGEDGIDPADVAAAAQNAQAQAQAADNSQRAGMRARA